MNNLLVVSSYPERTTTHSGKTVGIASYTKMLLEGLSVENKRLDITVLAEYFSSPNTYNENDIKIIRLWKRGSITSLLRLIKKILFTNNETILLSFEAYMFGSLFYSLPILISLGIAKMLGKSTILMLHQVPRNLDSMLKLPAVISAAAKAALAIFYQLINLVSSKVIVFEEALAVDFPFSNKTTVLPHLIPEVQKVTKKQAIKELNLKQNQKYILYFGYIAPYKGVLELVNAWQTQSEYELIIAGGINPNHTKNSKVTDYAAKVKQLAAEKNISVTGFVPEEKIDMYFAAADWVMLPYKTFMSSSGPLALAWSYQKPILLSKPLKKYFSSPDVSAALNKSGLKDNDLLVDITKSNLSTKLKNLPKLGSNAIVFSKEMSRKRSIETISKKLNKLVT